MRAGARAQRAPGFHSSHTSQPVVVPPGELRVNRFTLLTVLSLLAVNDTPTLLTKAEAAARLRMSVRTLERLIAADVFPKPLQVSPGRVVVLLSDVLTHLDSKLRMRIGRVNT
jgi:predicted DNA-binding transcriptional regulator AlpA